MTGKKIRDLLKPLIGRSGTISMAADKIGHIGFDTSDNSKLTGVELDPDGLVHLARETGWVVIDPAEIVAVTWQGNPEHMAGQFL